MSNIKRPSVASHLLGGGVGTFVVGLINSLPKCVDPAKPTLLLFVPTISIGLSVASHSAGERFRKRKLRESVREVRIERDHVMRDAHASPEHKKRIQSKLEGLEDVLTDSICDDTGSIGVIMAPGSKQDVDIRSDDDLA